MPLFLTESDVSSLLEPVDAVGVVEECFLRMAAGEVENAPRRRLRLPDGALADMAAADAGLGMAGGKLYAATAEGVTFVVCLFDALSGALVAVIEADQLGRLRTGAASGVAAKHLARRGASSLGVIGCVSAWRPRATARQAHRTSSSRSRARAIPCCAASGCARAPSSRPPARTS